MSTWAVIPVRAGGRRLAGKGMRDLAGRPLFLHVAERALAAGVDRVVVATDCDAVVDAGRGAGLEVVPTGPAPSGTHRVWEAVQALGPLPEAVVNVQGDQPLLDPSHIDAAVALLPHFDVGTVSAPLQEASNPQRVKVVTDGAGRALYFSRAPIPFGGPYRQHVGVYAFRTSVLARCVAASREGLARVEDLEQLAWLEVGIAIGVAEVESTEAPVDDEPDLERVRAKLRPRGSCTPGGTS